MKEMFQELIQYRQLIYILTWRDIKIKYKQTVMGFLWAIFMPMLIVSAGLLIRKAFSMVSGTAVEWKELASITVKALPWSFFIGSIKFGTSSLVGNANLVTKIYFPREVFPISAVLANLFDFAIASGVLVIILWIAGIGVSLQYFWIPLILFFLFLLTVGFSMIFACANLFFRDVKYIVEVIVTFAIFFTPVFYDASMLGKWEPVVLLNPVAVLLESLSAVIVSHEPPRLLWFLYSGVWAVGSLFLSWVIFHKAEKYFAENI
jgi:ABC-type polysaccharide/polyol phosphate export permease